MDQQTEARVAPALLRHARRALFLLGGAFVWWLLAAGTPAHAADTDGPDAAAHSSSSQLVTDGARQVAEEATGSVDASAGTASDTVRVAPGRLSSGLDAATASSPEPVRATVRRLTTATSPVLESSTTLLADTIDRTVHTVHGVVDPVLTAAGSTGTATAATASTPRTVHDAARTSTRPSVGDAATARAPGRAATAPSGGRVVPQQQPTQDRLPSGSTPVSAPSGSSGNGGSGACLGVLWLLSPLLAPRRRRRADDSIRPGPAFPPGCSPD